MKPMPEEAREIGACSRRFRLARLKGFGRTPISMSVVQLAEREAQS